MFNKWATEKSLLMCVFNFAEYQACFRGRIFGIAEDTIRVASDDKHSELALKINAEMEFGYGDSRKHPDEAELYESSLMVFFPPFQDDNPDPDFIAFTEFKRA